MNSCFEFQNQLFRQDVSNSLLNQEQCEGHHLVEQAFQTANLVTAYHSHQQQIEDPRILVPRQRNCQRSCNNRLTQKTRDKVERVKFFMRNSLVRGKIGKEEDGSPYWGLGLRRFGLRFSNEQGGSGTRFLDRPSCRKP